MTHPATSLLILRFFIIMLYNPSVKGCPNSPIILNLCKCEDSFSGIILECSGIPGPSRPAIQDPLQIFQALRENRVQLGIIQQLSLQNSTLAYLPAKLFDGLYVKKLDLSNNQISNISSDAFAGLENILQNLILANNSLNQVPFEALSKNNLLSLVQLDLSYNQIGDLMDDYRGFVGLPRLTDLNLAHNKICQIKKDTFANVKDTIQTLNLGTNCFTTVPAPAIRGFRQLLALHLHENQITELEPLQFMNLPGLNLINLAKNHIHKIHARSFMNVPNLRFAYLSDNNLTELDQYQFHTFEKLEMLDLTRNRLQSVPQLAFADMPRLSQLYLGENEILRIEPNAFSNSSLVILLLANNRLTSLTSDMFGGLTYLQQLSLKNNQIATIAPSTFYQLPSLVVLDLSDNQLAVLQPATFLAQLNLFLLDLSNNKLATVPYNALNQRIVSVLLNENPLVCTERVHVVQNNVGVFLPDVPNKICGASQPTGTLLDKNTDFVQMSAGKGSSEETPDSKQALNRFSRRNNTDLAVTLSPTVIIHPIRNNNIVSSAEGQFVGWSNRTITDAFKQPSQPAAFVPVNGSSPEVPALSPVNHPEVEESTDQGVRPETDQLPGGTGAAQVVEEPTENENDGRFQIPFRTNRPIIGPAFAVGPAFTLPPGFAPIAQRPGDETYTLPAGLILATIPPWTTPFKQQSPVLATLSSQPEESNGAAAPPPDSDLSRISFYPANKNFSGKTANDENRLHKTPAPKKPADTISPDAAVADYNTAYQSHSSGTTTIAVCLTVVVVVLVGVFVTLCAVRHRSRKSLSSSSRTSAYVAAQAAQLSYANAATLGYGSGAYCNQGTITRSQRPGCGSSVDPATVNLYSGLSRYAQQQQQQQQQNWLYGPNATYASASQYYK